MISKLFSRISKYSVIKTCYNLDVTQTRENIIIKERMIFMKKIKKSLAIILAVLICICSMSTVLASAATETQAVADAEAYNAIERDFSAYMGDVKEADAEKAAASLNTALAALLNKIDIKKVVYTDAVATTIIAAIGGLFNSSISSSMSGSAIHENYPEAYEYLFNTVGGGAKWDAVDNAQVKWGITPGNREAFAKAIGYGTSNFGSTIIFAGVMGEWMGQPDVYGTALAPIIESLHVGKLDSFNDAMKLGDNGIMEYLVSKICDAIDMLAANPVDYLCDVLPDFAANFESCMNVIGNLVASLGVSFDLPTFNGVIAMIGDKLGLVLPEVDVEVLSTMGTASAAESAAAGGYRMQINGNKAVVFMALAGYLKEVLADKANQQALTKLVVEKLGVEYDTFLAMVKGAKEDDTMVFVSSLLNAISQATAGSSPAISGFTGFIAKIMSIFIAIRDFFRDLATRMGLK